MSWEAVVWDSECTFRDSELSSPQPLQTQPTAGQGQDRGRTPAGVLTIWGPAGSSGDALLSLETLKPIGFFWPQRANLPPPPHFLG